LRHRLAGIREVLAESGGGDSVRSQVEFLDDLEALETAALAVIDRVLIAIVIFTHPADTITLLVIGYDVHRGRETIIRGVRSRRGLAVAIVACVIDRDGPRSGYAVPPKAAQRLVLPR